MPISEYQKKKLEKLKQRAFELYKQGLTTREVGALLKKSRQWVSNTVRELEAVENST